MTDYYTQFSFRVEGDAARMEYLMELWRDEGRARYKEEMGIGDDDLGRGDIGYPPCEARRVYPEGGDPGGVEFWAEEQGDVDGVINILAAYTEVYPDTPPIQFEYVFTASRPIYDAFGGGVAVVYKGKVRAKDTATMGREMTAALIAELG